MNDDLETRSGYTPDDVRAVIETLQGMIGLSEGELYTLRKGMLHPIQQREDDNGLRKVRVMEEAYDAAYVIAKRLRKTMRGYRPDPALVISALVMHGSALADADVITHGYLQGLFRADATPANA